MIIVNRTPINSASVYSSVHYVAKTPYGPVSFQVRYDMTDTLSAYSSPGMLVNAERTQRGEGMFINGVSGMTFSADISLDGTYQHPATFAIYDEDGMLAEGNPISDEEGSLISEAVSVAAKEAVANKAFMSLANKTHVHRLLVDLTRMHHQKEMEAEDLYDRLTVTKAMALQLGLPAEEIIADSRYKRTAGKS